MVRELADQITSSTKPGYIIVSIPNPGFVKTEVMRHASSTFHFFFKPYRKLVGRSTEEGARTLLYAAAGGHDTHGQYLSDCKVAMQVSYLSAVGSVQANCNLRSPSEFVRSTEGLEVQKRIWNELTEKLEDIAPGITKNI